MLPPGSTIGILGGGQLGRMTAMAAACLGYRAHIFATEHDSPAAQVSAAVTVAPFGDAAAVSRLAPAGGVCRLQFWKIPAAPGRRAAAQAAGASRSRILT